MRGFIMGNPRVGRRDFIRAAGASAAALGAAGSLGAQTEESKHADVPLAPATKFPKLAIITNFSRQKLAFATETGYEGVVVKTGKEFNTYLSDSKIAQILSSARETGSRIIR